MRIEGKSIIRNGIKYVPYRTPKGDIVLAVDPDAYQEITDMPDPIVGSFGVLIFNYTAATLYFTAEGSGGGTPWTWGAAQELEDINSGSSSYRYLPDLGSRDKPGSSVDDDIVITVRAYSDAAYSVEVGSGYPILITHHWIVTSDFTLLDEDNFDAGTTEDWLDGNYLNLFQIDTSYVLSAPNSLIGEWTDNYTAPPEAYYYIYKDFTIPAATVAYLILNIKLEIRKAGTPNATTAYWRSLQILEDDVEQALVRSSLDPFLYSGTAILYFRGLTGTVRSNWFRMVAPLTPDGTRRIKVGGHFRWLGGTTGEYIYARAYHDDIQLIYL